jgi:hypothetical protein
VSLTTYRCLYTYVYVYMYHTYIRIYVCVFVCIVCMYIYVKDSQQEAPLTPGVRFGDIIINQGKKK